MKIPQEPSSAGRRERAEHAAPARTPGVPASSALAFDGLGNRALLALHRSGQLQRKAHLSQPDDPREHAADRAAEATVKGDRPAPPPSRSRRTEVQRMPWAAGAPAAGAELTRQLSGGHGLDEQTRGLMESRFGEAFDDVRIHTGHRAGEMADAVRARAFTVGADIVFGEGEFAPGTTEGGRLLAHELAHVVQQRRPTGAVAGEKATEHDAHQAAHTVASGGTPAVRERAAAGSIQRQEAGKATGFFPPRTFSDRTLPAEPELKLGAPSFWAITVDGVSDILWLGGEADPVRPPSAKAWETSSGVCYVEVWAPAGVHSHGPWKDVRLGRPPTVGPVPPPKKPIPQPAPKPQPRKTEPPPQVLPELVIGPDEPEAEPAPASRRNEAAQQEAPAAPPPDAANANDLIDSYTSWGDLDERGLGKSLLNRALKGDTTTADNTLDTVGSTDRDDVSYEMVSQASDAELNDLARSEAGRKLLLRLYDELTSGYVSEDENKQALRILTARASNIDPKKFQNAAQTAPVIPFSGIGFTNFSSASLSVTRLDNGKIRVRSHMKPEHWKDAKRLPSAAFAAGLPVEFDPDQVVGINLIDEGKTIYVPAMFLLQLSNQEDTSAAIMAGTAVAAGLSLGAGSGVAAGRITAGRVAAGMGIGAGFSFARQGIEKWEGTRKEFSFTEAGQGALMGGGLVIMPQFGPMFIGGGALSAGVQFSEGHYALSAFDLGTAALPLGAKKMSSMPGKNLGRAFVFRFFMGTENLRQDTRTPGLPLSQDVVMVIDAAGKPVGFVDVGPSVAGPSGSTPSVSPSGTSAQPSANWMTIQFGEPYQPYNFGPLVVDINPQQGQAANPLAGVQDVAAAYGQQPPQIRQFGSAPGTQIVEIGDVRRYWQQGSKGGRGALWLPWIVEGEQVLSTSPVRGTEAEHPHATGGVKVLSPAWGREASPSIVLAEPHSRIKTPIDNALTQALKDNGITAEQWLAHSRSNIYRSWFEARAQGILVPTAEELAAAVLWQEAVMRAQGVPGF